MAESQPLSSTTQTITRLARKCLKKGQSLTRRVVVPFKGARPKASIISVDPTANQLGIQGAPALTLPSGEIFTSFWLNNRKQSLLGESQDQSKIIKIELAPHPRKKNSLAEEAALMQHLNQAGCLSCPTVFEIGTLDTAILQPLTQIEGAYTTYMVQSYAPAATKVPVADLLLSLIEQKAHGIYQGDLKKDNLRYNPETGICTFIDYDQAEHLETKTKNLGTLDFFTWCDAHQQERYNMKSWLDRFPELTFKKHIAPLFRQQAFNLAETSLYKRQISTNTPNGVYHTIRTNDLYADGIREMTERIRILDQISFEEDEKVLDVGCNAGLLSMYLHNRGCEVTGIEMDASILTGAKFIANIWGGNITYKVQDLDQEKIAQDFDTVMLFSVIHHTQNLNENAAAIAAHCKRIIIECRLQETGMKPTPFGEWKASSAWHYNTLEDLYDGITTLFPGFRMAKNHGQADRNRYILELLKK